MDWPTAAAIGQVVAAVFAIPSALFVGVQVRAASRNSDLQSMLAFNSQVADLERRLLDADGGWDRAAFVDYLNLLESYAAAMRARLLNRATRILVADKLVEALAVIESDERCVSQWEAAISTPMALSELNRFRVLRRVDIERAKRTP